MMIVEEVRVAKVMNYATLEKAYRAVLVLYDGQPGSRLRVLHRKFKRARDARSYGEQVMGRIER